MMVASLASYEPVTFLLTDQSALLRFYPDRDGPITDDWNVTYTDSNFADWSYDHNIGSGVRPCRYLILSSCLTRRYSEQLSSDHVQGRVSGH